MVRTVIIPESNHIEFDIPQEYVGKKIEVTYLDLDELIEKRDRKTMGDFWGILSDETAKSLHEHIEKTRDEWERNI